MTMMMVRGGVVLEYHAYLCVSIVCRFHTLFTSPCIFILVGWCYWRCHCRCFAFNFSFGLFFFLPILDGFFFRFFLPSCCRCLASLPQFLFVCLICALGDERVQLATGRNNIVIESKLFIRKDAIHSHQHHQIKIRGEESLHLPPVPHPQHTHSPPIWLSSSIKY